MKFPVSKQENFEGIRCCYFIFKYFSQKREFCKFQNSLRGRDLFPHTLSNTLVQRFKCRLLFS